MYRALVMVMSQGGTLVPTNDSGEFNAIDPARQGLKLGPDPLLEWAASHGARGTGLRDSTMLPYAGFYAMRGGWKPNDLFLFFRAWPAGIGHEHQDMLEVVLKRWGKTLLLDPGNALYDLSDFRRFVIGTHLPGDVTGGDPRLANGGSIWLSRTVTVPENAAGTYLPVNFGKVSESERVFWDGARFGSTTAEDSNAVISSDRTEYGRRYDVPGDRVKSGTANITVRLFNPIGPPAMEGRRREVRGRMAHARGGH